MHGTSATYRFAEDGTFEMSGYPPIKVVGRLCVSERNGKRLRLALTDQKEVRVWKKKARFAAVGERRRSRIGRRLTERLVEDARAEQ